MNLGVTMVFAIVAVILALSLKSKNPEYSTFISVAVCLCCYLSACRGCV